MSEIDSLLESVGIHSTNVHPETPSQAVTDWSEEELDSLIDNFTGTEVTSEDIDQFEEVDIENNGNEEPEDVVDYIEEDLENALASEEETSENNAEEESVQAETAPRNPNIQNPKTIDLLEDNPKSLMVVDDTTSRFSGTEWFNAVKASTVIIAGLGGIGSMLALQIGRLTPQLLVLYDDDVVEPANMSGQLYGFPHVGQTKVSAMQNILKDFTSCNSIYAVPEKFTQDTKAGDIMICGFDNMKARKTFFDSWKNHVDSLPGEQKAKCVFIDGRLSIDTLQVFCIRGDDSYHKQLYQKEYLFSSYEAERTVCSMKQTSFLACMIGSVMTNLFVNHIAGTLDPVIPYSLPFFTSYNSQIMNFITDNS